MAIGYSLLALDAVTADPALLDEDEQRQAGTYRFDRDRRRFVARRSGLRRLLADELGCAPSAIRYQVNRYGRPMVAGGPSFSVSRSRDHALVAIGTGGAIGCDIEWRDPALASPEVARRFFAPAEVAALGRLPKHLWLDGFFACWSRKEAYVKALGLGLSYPLDRFQVEVDPRAPARLIEALPGWRIHAFTPLAGLHAAIVTTEQAVPQALSVAARAIAA